MEINFESDELWGFPETLDKYLVSQGYKFKNTSLGRDTSYTYAGKDGSIIVIQKLYSESRTVFHHKLAGPHKFINNDIPIHLLGKYLSGEGVTVYYTTPKNHIYKHWI